jgi:molecular chaperone GrpE
MTTPSESEGTLPAEQTAAAGPGSLEAELLEAQATAQEHWNSYLRAVAETENVRKRAHRDVESASRYAIERFAGDLLEARDSLELGLAVGPGADPALLFEGMEATLRLVDRAFEKAGLQLVDPAGEAFNPEFHEAMAAQPSADQPPGTVLAVVQKGYLLNGRLLRPARVLVSREPDPPAG